MQFVRTTLKNLKTGRVLDNTFRAGESIEIVRVEKRKAQYLYREGGGYVFMDNETYEQITLDETMIDEAISFVKEGDEVEFLVDDSDNIVTVELPLFSILEVIETEPGFKGDTATNALKPAKLETGVTINVPLFINEGDVIKVDLRTKSYVERVKDK